MNTPDAAANNERILAKVESLGGDYVWDKVFFTVMLMDVAVSDTDAAILLELVGVRQVALNASGLSYSVLQKIASIRGLESLVLKASNISNMEFALLRQFVPEVLTVTE